jgi:hypothetical protein
MTARPLHPMAPSGQCRHLSLTPYRVPGKPHHRAALAHSSVQRIRHRAAQGSLQCPARQLWARCGCCGVNNNIMSRFTTAVIFVRAVCSCSQSAAMAPSCAELAAPPAHDTTSHEQQGLCRRQCQPGMLVEGVCAQQGCQDVCGPISPTRVALAWLSHAGRLYVLSGPGS